jgi:LuxR family maltose regulon positive regulatory protein
VIDAQRGIMDTAREKILQALHRGQRLGLVRSLLDAHPKAMELISEVARNEQLDPVLAFYVERLQAVQPPAPAKLPEPQPQPQAQTGRQQRKKKSAGSLIEPLSEREIDVVNMLAQTMPNKKIARALGLSPETVKWHLSQIYSKLGVNSRDEAVARMRDMEAKNAGDDDLTDRK